MARLHKAVEARGVVRATLSALATGVPNFPPGWSFAGFKGAA